MRWSLVPLLTFAGFISALYTQMFIWPVLDVGTTNEFPFAFFGSVAFALTLSAALWSLGLIPSWKTVTTFVAATVAVHFVYLFALEERLLDPLVRDVELPLLGRTELLLLTTYFVIALLVYSAFLFVLLPGRKKLRAPLIALPCAALAAFTVAFVNATQRGAWFSFWNSAMLELPELAVGPLPGCDQRTSPASYSIAQSPSRNATAARTSEN